MQYVKAIPPSHGAAPTTWPCLLLSTLQVPFCCAFFMLPLQALSSLHLACVEHPETHINSASGAASAFVFAFITCSQISAVQNVGKVRLAAVPSLSLSCLAMLCVWHFRHHQYLQSDCHQQHCDMYGVQCAGSIRQKLPLVGRPHTRPGFSPHLVFGSLRSSALAAAAETSASRSKCRQKAATAQLGDSLKPPSSGQPIQCRDPAKLKHGRAR